ncbi:UmuC domain [Dillenia turbinata]|uniref:DNA repair protein REV1 n=1 Tax=Dillenia turbinata TaxID=194707 RepID=A0AAN8WCE9_9MAGN
MSVNSSRSTGSDSRSRKRNSNSLSSIPSKSKKNQKTLGMAWGSNSLSSSRSSSFRSSPFSDFSSYMTEKNRKLQCQFNAEASSSSHSEKGIFRGVSIFVDGFTIPSSQELRGYMLKHGGRFENYFSRHRVTHIICSNLPDRVPYKLDQLANDNPNQPKLLDFFAPRSTRGIKDVSAHFAREAKIECERSTCYDDQLKEAWSNDGVELIKVTGQCAGKSDVPVHENIDRESNEESSFIASELCQVRTAKPDYLVREESNCRKGIQAILQKPSTSAGISLQTISESSTLSSLGPSNQQHSTLTDPNFVENYFKNSRLHFIGTWRNRYRKRFHSCNGLKSTSSNIDASSGPQTPTVIHVDMDCFFVSVVVRNHLELQDKPVAVCHSDNPRGTAEISSANYPARDYGVRAGIFVRDAKALCPHLVIVPYNFEAYEEVADQFYNILHKHCDKVQAVSCDEAFLDVTDSKEKDPELLASTIRKEIFETTGCSASAGISVNLLVARLATRAAKPDGQCYIPVEKVDNYLHELPVKALPGIGYVLEEKLKMLQVKTCGQLRMISKESLQDEFGKKTGDMLWNFSRGIDHRLVGVIQESKSIGAEVNWGVRFNEMKDTQCFLISLCKEVSLRLQGCGFQGRTFTVKIKKRKKDAAEPAKYMGCGDCENLSHSITVPCATDDADVIHRITRQLFGYFHLDVKEIRGVGLQVSKLENADPCNQGHERKLLRSWLTSGSARAGEKCQVSSTEMLKGDGDNVEDIVIEEMEVHLPVQSRFPEGKQSTEIQMVSTSRPQSVDLDVPTSSHNSVYLMPSSLSQVDTDVFQQLPEELRVDILKQLPDHRRPECSSDAVLEDYKAHQSEMKFGEVSTNSVGSSVTNNLWLGKTPQWVAKFRVSNCSILNFLAKMYFQSKSTGLLSSILQSSISDARLVLDISKEEWDEAICKMTELLKQFIDLKIQTDIEEIYLCFRLLKRFSLKSNFFLQVYDIVFPHLQVLFGAK